MSKYPQIDSQVQILYPHKCLGTVIEIPFEKRNLPISHPEHEIRGAWIDNGKYIAHYPWTSFSEVVDELKAQEVPHRDLLSKVKVVEKKDDEENKEVTQSLTKYYFERSKRKPVNIQQILMNPLGGSLND